MKNFISTRVPPKRRHGLSLMETLFAIGILLVGLVGITSVLGVAGRNAVSSRTLADTQNISNSSYSTFVGYGMNRVPGWRVWNHNSRSWNNIDPTDPSKIGVNESFCIDPLGLTSQAMDRTVAGNFEQLNRWYDRTLFPYYDQDANPLIDLSSDRSSNPAMGFAWLNQPRMNRLNLAGPAGSGGVISNKVAAKLFASQDEPAAFKPADKSVPPTRLYDMLPGTSTMGKASSQEVYSWFATLVPSGDKGAGGTSAPLPSEYILSIATVKNRDRVLDVPLHIGTLGDPIPSAVPSSEIITWVIPRDGVSSAAEQGSNLRCIIIGSAAVDSHLRSGDWIMLSRWNTTRNRGLHSWFRTINISADSVEGTLQEVLARFGITGSDDPYANNFGTGQNQRVWAYEAMLSGRNWELLFGSDLPAPIRNPPTTGTIVRGVVNVHERVVTLTE